MKDFDCDKAKAGYEVCTDEGFNVKIVDFKSPVHDRPITAYIQFPIGGWDVKCVAMDGKYPGGCLKLKPKIRTGYVLMDAWKGSLYLCGRPIPYVEYPFDKREAAENTKRDIEKNFDVPITIATITWEE